MKQTIGGLVVSIGVLAILLSAAMPATQTHTARSCYDDPTGYGQECVSTSYQAPNTGKSSAIGFGVISLIIGGILLASHSSKDESQGNKVSDNSQDTNTLAAQLQEMKKEEDQ